MNFRHRPVSTSLKLKLQMCYGMPNYIWLRVLMLTQQVLYLLSPFSSLFFVCMCGGCFVVLCVGIFCLCVYLCTICHGLTETRRGHHIPGTGVYRCLWAAVWTLVIKPGSFRRAAGALCHLSIPDLLFLKTPDIVQAGILTPKLSCTAVSASHMVGYRYRPWWPSPTLLCWPHLAALYMFSHSLWIIKLVWHTAQETR